MAASSPTPEPAPDAPSEVIAAGSRAQRFSRPVLATIIALAAAVLVAVLVIVVFVVPKGGTAVADAPVAAHPSTAPSSSASSRPSSTPSATPKPTKTPDAAAPAPAPVDPVPVADAPAPVDPAPAPLPEPPAPVIPTPTITSMDAYYSGPCTASTQIFVAWTSNNGTGATMNVRSGGGTPIFNQNWVNLPANGNQGFWLDCTRPVWFFSLTVSNSANTKDGRLTFANGSNQGWSSN